MTRLRTALGVAVAVLAGMLAPLAIVADWAHTQVDDTEAFVASYAPLARSDAVQTLLNEQLTDAIATRVPGGDNAIVRRLVARQVAAFIASDLFNSAWEGSLRLAHGELRSLLTGEPGRLQVTEGEVQLRLAPFVDAVKQRLAEAGVPGIDRLPEVTGGITLLRVDPQLLPVLQRAYRGLAATAAWLSWAAGLLAVVALVVWPNRRRALITLGVSTVLATLAVWLVAAGGVGLALRGLAEPIVPVAGTIADAALSPIREPALALIVATGFLATLAWLSVPPPATARAPKP